MIDGCAEYQMKIGQSQSAMSCLAAIDTLDALDDLSGFHFGKPWLHRLVVAKGQEISLRRVYVISMISLYVGVDDFSEALVM